MNLDNLSNQLKHLEKYKIPSQHFYQLKYATNLVFMGNLEYSTKLIRRSLRHLNSKKHPSIATLQRLITALHNELQDSNSSWKEIKPYYLSSFTKLDQTSLEKILTSLTDKLLSEKLRNIDKILKP